MEQLFKLAQMFRAAIEKTPQSKFHTSLGCSKFPHACCDDASLLLAAYMSDKGHAESIRVHGTRGGASEELESHVWLLCSGFVIDITADQFAGYGMAPVVVTKNSELHESFEVESIEPADFRVKFMNDLKWLSLFNKDYETVLSHMNRC